MEVQQIDVVGAPLIRLGRRHSLLFLYGALYVEASLAALLCGKPKKRTPKP